MFFLFIKSGFVKTTQGSRVAPSHASRALNMIQINDARLMRE